MQEIIEGWLPVSQQVIFKTALVVWKCIHGLAPAYLSNLYTPATATSVCEKFALCIQSNSTGSARPHVGGAAKFWGKWTDHLEQSAACTTSTSAVTERLHHTCTEDAPVLDHTALLRHFAIPASNINHLLTYLLKEEWRAKHTAEETLHCEKTTRKWKEQQKNMKDGEI